MLRNDNFLQKDGIAIVHITHNDLMGSRFNGHTIHQFLKNSGHESYHLVGKKYGTDSDTVEYKSIFARTIQNIERTLSVHYLLYLTTIPLLLSKCFRRAKLVHYHVIHQMNFSILALPILTRLKPSIWTIHDMWAFTGHCIQSLDCDRWLIGCGKCPDLKIPIKIKRDTTSFMWKIKKWVYRYSKFDLVVASKWMQKKVKASPLLSHFNVHLIPFGIDLDLFCPRESRIDRSIQNHEIPDQNLVLTFRASDMSRIKGFSYLIEALKNLNLKTPITIITTGQEIKIAEQLPYKIEHISFPWVFDDKLLAEIYRVSDICIVPSLGESFCMTAIEAMACGTPVVCFKDTVVEETAFSDAGASVAVKYADSVALASAIEDLANNKAKRLEIAKIARQIAVEHYDDKVHFARIKKLYREILNRKTNRKNEQ